MSAFYVIQVQVKDMEGFKAYGAGAAETLKPFSGSVAMRGRKSGVIQGEMKYDIVTVLNFPTIEDAHGWYNSDAYQALIPQREAASTMNIVLYEDL